MYGMYPGCKQGWTGTKKIALAFLLRPAHHNQSDTTHQYTILAVPVNMPTYCSIPQKPYKAG